MNTGNDFIINTKYMSWWYGYPAQSPFSSVMFHVIIFSMLLFILYYTYTTNTKNESLTEPCQLKEMNFFSKFTQTINVTQ